MFKYLFLIFSLVLSLQVQAMPKIGEPAPEVETVEFSLKNCKSQFVVLYFYPKNGTANCTIEAQKFAAYYQDFQKLGAEIVGVSNDLPESHKAFAEKLQLPFTLISDDGSLIKSYDVSGIIWTQRATFLIDKDRNVAYIWRSVNVANHAEEVLKKIQEFSDNSSIPVASEKSTTLQKEAEDIKAKLEKTLKEVDSLKEKLEKKLKEIERNMQ
jgi:peroxiredoxin Q/BCP